MLRNLATFVAKYLKTKSILDKQSDNPILIRSSKDGSLEEFEILLEKHRDDVTKYITQLMGNEYDANDIVQETFIKAFTRIDLYRENSSFPGWLCSIAKNTFIDTVRKNSKRTDIEINEYNQTTIEIDEEELWYNKEEKITNLESSIQQLPQEYIKVLNMRYYLDMSYEDISNKMNVPIGTIKTWIHRAKNELKKQCK